MFGIVWDCLVWWHRNFYSLGNDQSQTKHVEGSSNIMTANVNSLTANDTTLDFPLSNDDDIFNQFPHDISLDFLHDGVNWSNEDPFWA